MNINGAMNFVHASDSRDASMEWEALDALAAEVRRLRESLASCQQGNRDLLAVPRYDTEAVDELLAACDDIDVDTGGRRRQRFYASIEAVRESREPRK